MSFIHISFNFLYRIRNLVAEQAIEAMDFTFECRYPNCEFSANKTNLEAHERECENRHVVCRWCSWRVEFDTNEDHELSCGLRSSLVTTSTSTQGPLTYVGHNGHNGHVHGHINDHGHHHHQYYPQHVTHEMHQDLSGWVHDEGDYELSLADEESDDEDDDLIVNLHLNEEENFARFLGEAQGGFAFDTAGIPERQEAGRGEPRRRGEGARVLQRRPS